MRALSAMVPAAAVIFTAGGTSHSLAQGQTGNTRECMEHYEKIKDVLPGFKVEKCYPVDFREKREFSWLNGVDMPPEQPPFMGSRGSNVNVNAPGCTTSADSIVNSMNTS